MRILVAFWFTVYGVIGVALGVRYYEIHRPLFETNVAVLTADNINRLEVIGELPGNAYEVPFFDPNGRLAMVSNTKARLYDLSSGKRLGDLYTNPTCSGLTRIFGCFDPYAYYYAAAALSPDGKYMAIIGNQFNGHEIRVWNMENGWHVETLRMMVPAASGVIFFPNSHVLLYTNPQQGLWGFNADTKITQQLDPDDAQRFLAATDDRVYYLTSGNSVRSVGTNLQVEEHFGNIANATVATVSPDGRYFVGQLATNELLLQGLQTQRVRRLNGHQQAVTALVFSHDMRYMFSADTDGTIIQWDVESAGLVRQIVANQGGQWSLALGSQNDILIARNWGIIAAWDVGTGTRLLRIELDRSVSSNSIYLSPDGRFLVTEDGRMFGVVK